ncbi:MAG: 23S rRNA (pseudouridine(1915)-N(3))-methyltransferase RlmH [Eubacteriales bacterium]|nr:23S rRNA (pseudouridine(1915)-N(3))-methyltransferase RlmH [Eubacteriales bacterium]
MNVRILAVGKLKEAWQREAVAEYEKRLGRFCRLTVVQVEDERDDRPAATVKQKEGARLLARIAPTDHVVAMAIEGREYDSVAFAAHLENLSGRLRGDLVFVIGGSVGLDEAVLERADEQISLSRMTFHHMMARVILLEQIYRAFKINAGETYHK